MKNWQMGSFIRPLGINPIISPIKESIFECPMRKQKINWEMLHTFNPAAVVKENKVILIYRAEDDSGKKGIGSYTSRFGLAESHDGLHFKRKSIPIFYPANDSQKSSEWEGGCEDPRLIEAEDGTYFLTYTNGIEKQHVWLLHHQKILFNGKNMDRFLKAPIMIGKIDGRKQEQFCVN